MRCCRSPIESSLVTEVSSTPAYFHYGSPATRYGLWAGRRVVEVNGQPTPDLDAFLGVVEQAEDRESLRITTLDWNDAPQVITLKLDKQYWRGFSVHYEDGGWLRATLD